MAGDVPKSQLNTDPLLGSAAVHEGYKVLGGVVLYQKLGQGGMGAVYRGAVANKKQKICHSVHLMS